MTYTMNGHHRARLSIRDPAWGYRYVDQYNYGIYDIRYNDEGQGYPVLAYFEGRGPALRRTLSDILLPRVFDKTAITLFNKAKLCNLSADFVDTGKQTATLNAADSGCAQSVCDDPEHYFTVTVDFILPKDATGVSTERSYVKSFGRIPSENEYQVGSWRFENVNVSTLPKGGQIVMSVRRRGRGEEILFDKIEVNVAGDFERGTFNTLASLKVVCP